ncbi:DUF882 domain-containing protein [Aquisalimonas sp.]|uniref:DUF882 domain-containing protein n=1 Tax=Aquisalimonas sp. TaxID=1872621 RepID=UPI0025C62207|nr:DUF882 domain-containing protein [Aquisalimonas sp.]
MCSESGGRQLSRRRIIAASAWALAGAISPSAMMAFAASRQRSLRLHNLHTGEALSVTYWEDGNYLPDAVGEISYLLRDHRTDAVHPIDTELLDTLNALQSSLGFDARYEVISGYRSPATNEMLRRKGRAVAKRSMHMEGKAVDVRVPGQPLERVRQAAMALRAGGVGHYENSGFLHVDVGRVRSW